MDTRTRLRSLAVLLVLTFDLACSRAQTAAQSPADSTAPPPEAKLSAAELEQLVAPIALYPDVLIAQILPAATFPTDVVLAARWLRSKPDMAGLDEKPWDESVKVLCHYSSVLFKLDEDLDWTNALGAAFLAQQDDMMNAIQQGREKAKGDGLLQTNEQQTIVVEEDTIRIVPTQTEVVYVPQYQPEVIYVENHVDTGAVVAASAISFGTGMALGAWLNMDCNWHGHSVNYCQPGYWGGWAHRGTVAWGDGWAAGAGPRRAFAAGEDRGFVAGPRGAAAWGPNGGAAWRRPAVATPRPAYTGRYAGYGARSGGRYGSNNQVNLNRTINNTSIDRGNRTSIGGGDRTGLGAGQRSDRRGGGTPQQLPAGASGRTSGALGSDAGRSSGRSSAFDTSSTGSQLGAYGQRGRESRDSLRSSGGSPRPSSSTPQFQPSRSSSRQPSSSTPRSASSRSSAPSRSSAFSSGRSGGQMRQYSSRGSSSRGFGGGGRRGGGRR